MSTSTTLRLAERMSRLGTERAFEVLARTKELEAQGKEIIHLEIGEPDFATPAHIIDSATQALRDGWTHYGPSAGLLQLREAVAEFTSRRLGLPVDASEVVITPGAKPIMFFTILALVDAGDEVLYPNPGFPIYESMIEFVGARPVPYSLLETRDFDLDPAEIISKISERTRLIILNSPQNPTGGVLSPASVAALAQAIVDRGIFVLSDEVYHCLIYEGEDVSISQFPGMKDWTIILDGFSKMYAMTGWRLGFGVMRRDLAQHVARLMTNSNSCTASFTQIAGTAALRGDQSCVTHIREQFRQRRQVMIEGMNHLPGVSCRMPRGAFYAFPNITATGHKSDPLADALLTGAGVACLAGTAFGSWGEGYLRFSFANSINNIQRALDKIESWLQKNR